MMDSFSVCGSDDWGEAPDTKDLHSRLFTQSTGSKDQPRGKKSKVNKQNGAKALNPQTESIKVAYKSPETPQPKSSQEKTDDAQAHGSDKRGTKKKRKMDTNESRIPVEMQASASHEEKTKVEVGIKKRLQSEASTPSEPISVLEKKKRKRKPRNNKFKSHQEVQTVKPNHGLTPSTKEQTETMNKSNSNVESNTSTKSQRKKLKRRGKDSSVSQKLDSKKVAIVKEETKNQRTKSNIKKSTLEKVTNIQQQRTKTSTTGKLNNKKNKSQSDKVNKKDLKTATEVNIQQARAHFESLSKEKDKGDPKESLNVDNDEDAFNGSKEPPPDHTAKQTLKSKMEARLNSAHFRYLNEQLYKTSGSEAYQMMSHDREAFEIYHSGFSQQVKQWPVNPVDIFIEHLNTRPENLTVGDFGCGEARIAQSVKQTVHSFDFCSLNRHVTVCDMEKVPLKSNSLDIAIFCLSLMGTNWMNYIKEANRVLKMKGQLKIAEVSSRFTSFTEFLKIMKQLGFQKESTDFSNKIFLMMEFSKQTSAKKVLPEKGEMLRPCLYKKR
ncbi:uncharacterized protein [Asterias amurensis]|uniref:uncharacterized protein isoform X2 n=1 Tax=Asterias amurensis TaxID=7602 RepID=UPI003AB90461